MLTIGGIFYGGPNLDAFSSSEEEEKSWEFDHPPHSMRCKFLILLGSQKARFPEQTNVY